MRAVVQRVASASVTVDGKLISEIGKGLLIFHGVAQEDTSADLDYLTNKVANLRVFEDDEGRMNRSLLEVGGEALVVSQFTLYGDCRKGRRPSFIDASSAGVCLKAEALYQEFIEAHFEYGDLCPSGNLPSHDGRGIGQRWTGYHPP